MVNIRHVEFLPFNHDYNEPTVEGLTYHGRPVKLGCADLIPYPGHKVLEVGLCGETGDWGLRAAHGLLSGQLIRWDHLPLFGTTLRRWWPHFYLDETTYPDAQGIICCGLKEIIQIGNHLDAQCVKEPGRWKLIFRDDFIYPFMRKND